MHADMAGVFSTGKPINEQCLVVSLLYFAWTGQVGEWEVNHALRRSEEELRGKDLASREGIEELLTLIRRDATATNHDRGRNEDSGTIGRQREVSCATGAMAASLPCSAYASMLVRIVTMAILCQVVYTAPGLFSVRLACFRSTMQPFSWRIYCMAGIYSF